MVSGKFQNFEGFDTLAVVTAKFVVFWSAISCILVHIYQLFGAIFCLYLQGREETYSLKLETPFSQM
jgi:hypothetical protein